MFFFNRIFYNRMHIFFTLSLMKDSGEKGYNQTVNDDVQYCKTHKGKNEERSIS